MVNLHGPPDLEPPRITPLDVSVKGFQRGLMKVGSHNLNVGWTNLWTGLPD